MQKLLFLPFLLCLFFVACKQDSKTSDTATVSRTASPNLLGGFWVAIDFCSRANQYGSVLQAMNNSHAPYAYALTFNPGQPDSVTCYNGIESWNLPVKYNADTLELVGARPGKSVFLIYNSQLERDNDITMFDATTGRVQMDRFIKSNAGTVDALMAFRVALNHNIFGGLFTPLAKGATGDVQFTPGGFIMGAKDYDRYEVCVAGDCFVAGQDIDVVTLSNSKIENSGKPYGYSFSAQNDTLTFFNLLNKNPDEKGTYVVGTPAYKFLRKKTK